MSDLQLHAKHELELANLFGEDSDYDGVLGRSVMELIEVFSKQGHSGYSAAATIDLFTKLASYKPLTAIGKSKDEWIDVTEQSGEPLWQNKRRSTTFSRDGGKTWYDIDDPSLNNDDVWISKDNNETKEI